MSLEPGGIIAWIVLGLIAGFIASLLVNRRGEGFFWDIILGIIGAVVGGFARRLYVVPCLPAAASAGAGTSPVGPA